MCIFRIQDSKFDCNELQLLTRQNFIWSNYYVTTQDVTLTSLKNYANQSLHLTRDILFVP
jgi:hypothetical protein